MFATSFQQVKLWLQSAGPLGLMGREPARQTSELASNPSWNATVYPLCEIFNVMRVLEISC